MVLSLSLLIGCRSTGPGSDPVNIIATLPQATLAQTLDEYLNTNIGDDQAGMGIMVISDNQVTYLGIKGLANKNSGTRISSESGFRIASLSKSFTALAVMQLVEQNRLSVDDKLITYLPQLPQSWNEITLHHLLSHKSGIPDFINEIDYFSWPDGVTNQQVITYFSDNEELNFSPGTANSYSNSGYLMLAQIVTSVSGTSFHNYMRDNIFLPLGMTSSYIDDQSAIPADNLAINYAQSTQIFGRNFKASGANGMVSTFNDMERFVQGMLFNQVVMPQTLEIMLRHYSNDLAELSGAHYGYGWILPPNTGFDAFAHSGGLDGYQSRLLIDRDLDFSVVILGNGGGQTSNHDFIVDLIVPFYVQQ